MYVFAEAARLPSTVVRAAVDEYWHPDFMRSHAGYEIYLEKSLDGVLFHTVCAFVQVLFALIFLWIARERIRRWDQRAHAPALVETAP
jgi:hypothetical protein